MTRLATIHVYEKGDEKPEILRGESNWDVAAICTFWVRGEGGVEAQHIVSPFSMAGASAEDYPLMRQFALQANVAAFREDYEKDPESFAEPPEDLTDESTGADAYVGRTDRGEIVVEARLR